MEDDLGGAIEAASARLDSLTARLEALAASLTEESFSMLEYARRTGPAAPRTPEVLGEQLRRGE